MRISDWSSDVCSSDLDYTVALASEAHGTASRALSVTVPTDSTGVDLAVGSGSIAVSLPDEAEAPSAIVRVAGEDGPAELVGTITDHKPVAPFAGLTARPPGGEGSQAGLSTERPPAAPP